MDLEELLKKRDDARSMEHGLPDLTFRDMKELVQARSEDDDIFFIHLNDNQEDTVITYSKFYGHVLDCTRFLQNHGLSRGDRIATIAHNHWHTTVQYFAAWLLGLVVMPVNLEEEDEHIAHILERSKVELAFVRTEYRSRFRKILERYDNLKHIEWIVCEGEIENFTSQKGTINIDDASYAESAALLTFTGGQEPLGVVLTQRNLLETARSIAEWHNMDNETRTMCVLPIHQTDNIVLTIVAPFYTGGSIVLGQQFQSEYFFPNIADYNVNIVSLKPPLLETLADHYEASGGSDHPEVPTLQYILCRELSPHPELVEEFEEQCNVRIVQGYGVPGTTSYASCMPVDLSEEEHKQWRSKQESLGIGRPLPVNEMAIHDQDGNKLAEKERGEIVVRGANVMLKYYNNRRANERAFKNGWFCTGDEGFYINDKEGRPYFFVIGRFNTD